MQVDWKGFLAAHQLQTLWLPLHKNRHISCSQTSSATNFSMPRSLLQGGLCLYSHQDGTVVQRPRHGHRCLEGLLHQPAPSAHQALCLHHGRLSSCRCLLEGMLCCAPPPPGNAARSSSPPMPACDCFCISCERKCTTEISAAASGTAQQT